MVHSGRMKAVLEYLATQEARFIDDLCAYARFPSVSAQSAHRNDLKACADWITDRCRAIGLKTRLHATPGNPILVASTPKRTGHRPRFLVYGHYDVQPAEPFHLWTTPPFEPRIDGRNVYARGISDNKGQHLAHLNAVEAYLATGTELPCDLVFVIEGEEEVGSGALQDFLPRQKELLTCDGVIISDNGIPSLKHPALTYALRGVVAAEIRLDGPDRDLHSGIFGGTVENPAMALCQMLARLRDDHGRIQVPGLYDRVVPLSDFEREQLAKLPFSSAQYKKLLGSPKLFGEEGYTSEEQRTARPTLEINGLTSGYQGEGSKTIVPAWASAKLTLRLVPDQRPDEILRLLKRHLKSICPPTVRMTFTSGHGGEPYLVQPEGPMAQACLRALSSGFGRSAHLMREGGSIPIVSAFKKHLGVDTYLLGMALPDDNAHSPNEKFNLDAYAAGMRTSAHLWTELAQR